MVKILQENSSFSLVFLMEPVQVRVQGPGKNPEPKMEPVSWQVLGSEKSGTVPHRTVV